MTHYFSKAILPTWVTRDEGRLFTLTENPHTFVLRQTYSMRHEEENIDMLFLELTDGHYWIPAMTSFRRMQQILGCQDVEGSLSDLYGAMISVEKTMLGVYHRGEVLAPAIYIAQFKIQDFKATLPFHDIQDIYTHPRVKTWLTELQRSLPDFSAIFAGAKPPELRTVISEYEKVLEIFEWTAYEYYGPVPPSEEPPPPFKDVKEEKKPSLLNTETPADRPVASRSKQLRKKRTVSGNPTDSASQQESSLSESAHIMQKDVNPAPVLVKEERTMYAPLTQDEVMAIFRAPLTNATCVISLDQAILLDPDEYKGTAVAGHPSPSAPDMAVPVAMESPGSIPMRPSSEVGRGAEMTMDSLKGESELEVVKHRLLSNLETQSSLKRHARLDRFRKAQFFCALGDLRIHDSTSYHDPSSSMSS